MRILVQRHNWVFFFFFFENEQGAAVTINGDRYRAMLNEFLFTKIEEQGEAVTVNGDRYRATNFSSQKLKRMILATFGFNRRVLGATQPKLHSMICALFLKIALSASELRFDTVGPLFVGCRQR